MKELFFKIILVFVSLLIASFIGEAFIRLLYPELVGKWTEREHFYTYDPALGWKGKANTSGFFKRKDFKVNICHNNKGFRGGTYNYEKLPGTKRILAIGDSYVWGYGVEEQEIFTSLLEKQLDDTEVINLGCSGYGNDQELLLLKSEGLKYQPDIIVVVITLPSDFVNNANSIQYSCPKPFFESVGDTLLLQNIPVPRRTLGQRMDNFLTQRSALFVFLKFLKSKVTEEAILLTHDLLLDMKNICYSKGIEVLFVLNPSINPKTKVAYRSAAVEKLSDFLAKDALKTVDLYELFNQKIEQGEQLTFDSDAHWNQNGHQIVSEELYKLLKGK